MVIVLFGVRGAGKDTVGKLLVDSHLFTRAAFADPIKRMIQIAFPDISEEDLWGPSSNRENMYWQYPTGPECVGCGGRLRPADAQRDLYCTSCGTRYPTHLNARVLAQTLGTQWGRRLFPDVWAECLWSAIDPAKYVVITDGRFLNELRASRAHGAYCVRLTRNLWTSTDSHASEAEQRSIPDSEFDYIIDNASMFLDALPAAVDDLVRHCARTPPKDAISM